jgi:acyl-coenzyme A synthetase/AMP-(fatty) acid ligase
MSILPHLIGNIFDAGASRLFTSAEILELVEQRSLGLFCKGIRKGDKVVICHGNSIQFFIDLFSCWNIGACAVPVDPTISKLELNGIENFVQPAIVLKKDTLLPVDSTFRSSMHEQVFGLDDDALILFTSGSTSEPKGVVHTYRSLLAKIAIAKKAAPKEEWQNTLCIIPTHFVYGLISNSLVPLFQGCSLFVYPAFNLQVLSDITRIVQLHSITAFCSVPSMWKIIFDFAPPLSSSSLRRVHCAAAPLSRDLWLQIKTWTAGAEVKNVYGATEMGCAITGPKDGQYFHDGLIGKGWDTRVVVFDDSRQPCKVGEIGEVYLQGPSMMKGYYKRPDATNEVIQQGWYRTGDLGTCAENGDVTLVGRMKYVINKAGMKIYPEDVESILMTNDLVLDICVFGWDDQIAGQTVGAAVVFKQNDRSRSLEQLEAWSREHISAFKVPTKWFVLKELPRTTRGKINRANLMESLKS